MEGFSTRVYRKETAILQPIHYTSLHHPAQKWGGLTSATLRARKLSSQEKDLWTELRFIRDTFVDRGYPIHRIHQTMLKALHKPLWTTNSQHKESTCKLGTLAIRKSAPYIPEITIANQKNWERTLMENEIQAKVQFSFKPDTNLLHYFAPRYQEERDQKHVLLQTGVVYGVACVECQDNLKIHYIGETSRTLRERIYSHFYDKHNKSALRSHTENKPGSHHLPLQHSGQRTVGGGEED